MQNSIHVKKENCFKKSFCSYAMINRFQWLRKSFIGKLILVQNATSIKSGVVYKPSHSQNSVTKSELANLMLYGKDFHKIRVKTIRKNHGMEADPFSEACNKHIFCHSNLTWPQFVQTLLSFFLSDLHTFQAFANIFTQLGQSRNLFLI